MKGRRRKKSTIGIKIVLASAAACFLWLLLMPDFRDASEKDMRLSVVLNGVEVGVLSSKEDAQNCLRMARRAFARERLGETLTSGALALSDAELVVTNISHAAGKGNRTLDDETTVTNAMLDT